MIVFCCVLPASNKARDDDRNSAKTGKFRGSARKFRGPRKTVVPNDNKFMSSSCSKQERIEFI